MKQERGERLSRGLLLMKQDIRQLWPAAAVLGAYFLVGRRLLHSLCPSVFLTGFPCPGCGMTRAILSILRGNFADAWYLHPFSYVLLAFLAVVFLRRYVWQKELKSLVKYAVLIGAAMVVFYIYRMVRYFPGDPPMSYYSGSLLGRIFQL